MKLILKKYFDNIKNHPEPQKFARANFILAFLLVFSFVVILTEIGGFWRCAFATLIGILIVDSVVCYVIARKVARKNETKKTN